MTADEERWGEALAVHRRCGDGASLHVAERLGALAGAGDALGIERWQQIASRIDQLRAGQGRLA